MWFSELAVNELESTAVPLARNPDLPILKTLFSNRKFLLLLN